jgi:hypothetical protein
MEYTFNIELTAAKMRNLHTLIDDIYTSFSATTSKVNVITSRELSESEQATLQAAIENVADYVVYNSNTLISWAMAQIFTAELIPHFAAFLDFANKANEASKANFLAYATAVSLTSTANTIIAKAIELGAPITNG